MTTTTAALVQIRDELKEPIEATWLDPELRGYINKTLKDIARRTFYLRDTSTINAIAETAEYTAAANIIRIDECEWVATGDTRQHSLVPRPYGIVQQYQSTDVSDPVYYTTWGVPPTLKFRVYPSPYSTGVFTLSVRRFPIEISVAGADDANQLELPSGWDDVMYEGVLAKAFRADRQYEESDRHLRDYEEKVSDMIELVDNYTDAPDEIRYEHPYGARGGHPWYLEW